MTALLDASGPFPMPWTEAFPTATDADRDLAKVIDPEAFDTDGLWNLAFRCFAIRRPDGRVAIVDLGVGPANAPAGSWAPVPGHLPDVMSQQGIDVTDVDTVVITHLHEDHIGWGVDRTGHPLFPNASYLVQRDEVSHLDQRGRGDVWDFIVEPLQRAGQLQLLDGRTELSGGGPGSAETITVIPTPGHTFGHQSVMVNDAEKRLFITGDVLVHALQLANPSLSYRFEYDKDQAARTRIQLLGEAKSLGAVLATAHLGNPFQTLI